MNLVELTLVMVYDDGICGLELVLLYELGLVVVYGLGLWWYMDSDWWWYMDSD